MKRKVALFLCGLLLLPLLPLPVKALDYDPRRIGTKYTQGDLSDVNEENPWVEKHDPSSSHDFRLSTRAAQDQQIPNVDFLSMSFWMRVLFPYSLYTVNSPDTRVDTNAQADRRQEAYRSR
jgi:hypothetical protein